MNGFVENVNTIANATTLATGDIIEDTQIARDEAQAAAVEAKSAATNADDAEELAQAWANKQYNNPVENGEFSAYHWSVKASQSAGSALIDDLVTSVSTTWSSTKISSGLSSKAETGHDHTGVYEPTITKNSAFNKNFGVSGGTVGSSVDVARLDHTHSGYEDTIGTKGTAFNKNFGTNAGEVSEGTHDHSLLYESLRTSQGTAYNKDFGTTPGTVSNGEHIHSAVNISYDPTGDNIVTSTTVDGALSQLDASLGIFEVGARAKVIAGMTNSTYALAAPVQGDPNKLITAMTVGSGMSNVICSGGDVVIDYLEDPTKLIEGWYSTTVTIDRAADTQYAVSIAINDVVESTTFRGLTGAASNQTAGSSQVTLDGFIGGLSNGDRISVVVYNLTSTDNITISAHTVSFAGAPEGALIASGITVTHNDILAKDALNQHPFKSIYSEGSGYDLNEELALKADKIVPAAVGNIATLDEFGNLTDSGVLPAVISGLMNLVGSPTINNIVTMTSGGDSADSGITIAELASINGAATEEFKVKVGTDTEGAVARGELATMASDYTLESVFNTHVGTANPHNTTAGDVGAALTIHAHDYSDITTNAGALTLTDDVNSKYAKVSSPATDNIVVFETGDLLRDSGVAYDSLATNTSVATRVDSDITGVTAQRVINTLVMLDTDYDALVTKDPNTIYNLYKV